MEKIEKNQKTRANFWIKLSFSMVVVFLFVIVVKINMQINDLKVVLERTENEYQERLLSVEKLKSDIKKLPDNIEDLDEATLKKIANDELNLRDSDIIIFANSQPN